MARATVRYSRWAWRFLTSNTQNEPFLSSAAATFSTAPENANPGRPGPPPIRVALTESSGRGVFATRKIETGELLHTAKPILSHPSLSALHKVCYFCLRKLKTTDAPQPHGVSYCSEECRQQAKGFHDIEMTADWSAYDDYCRSNRLKYPLLVKRLACMVMSGATPANLLDILQPASLSPEMISEMEEGYGLLRNAYINSNITDEQMSFLTKQWYIGILSRIRINAFRIELAGGYDDLLSSLAASIESEAAVGNAVYMLPSFYNHDCDPNGHIIWIENADARLKALRDVDEGEELRICYIDASMDHDALRYCCSLGHPFVFTLCFYSFSLKAGRFHGHIYGLVINMQYLLRHATGVWKCRTVLWLNSSVLIALWLQTYI
ncbi:histone-lysine N-methyltransferase ATXR4 isoform X1 [Rosa chinensis]|uniref:histone-lysine N-methyltransferase ATXR4 isoform X1 n=1 Tax=Rosa chinensis TaxID=74649 RepID=UPI001AD8D7FD|nr:histone-lysine N-methyltransferase ATXR4 isoform X1 [Rosa chinensis]